MHICDVAIAGGGPAGSMAAIHAASAGRDVILIEKNPSIGVKILLTGAGRCNLTNIAPMDVFIEKFGAQGQFLRTAFHKFSNEDLMDFFKSEGLELKDERQGRVFPATDRASSVTDTLKKCLEENKVRVMYKTNLLSITKKEGIFELHLNDDKKISAKKAVLATGGVSYPETGSNGDGLRIARQLGHTVTPLKAALVPLKTAESWIKELQGVALENIRVTFAAGGKKLISGIGELMFTHFGVSGPLVLDLSGAVMELVLKHKEARLFIDLKPGLDEAKLETRLLGDLNKMGRSQLLSVMEGLLPKRMAPVFLRIAGLDPLRKASQITKPERAEITRMLKQFQLTIKGSLSIDEGMVTNGGVSTKQINPRTMESRIVPGLYFAGEIIDGAAPSGGYNLQQAFSTGFLAGEETANA
ncbi:MAG: NAD(P)/FAD-dependent oxidoreductase [Candidatus Omnitrophica bacterium]|nr:NAD(P)/FAD-dependent oxidoreductase [Candidatus Omnitrophota bacterium]